MTCIQIIVVDTNAVLRNGIQAVLERTLLPRSRVAARDDLPELAELAQYDVLYLDDARYMQSELVELLRHLKSVIPRLRIVVMSQQLSVARIQKVIQNGALGFIHKGDDLEHSLNVSVSTVCRDLAYLSPRAAERLATVSPYVASGDLTAYDTQVLQMTAQDLTVGQIAATLNTSIRSVYRAKAKIRDILNIQTTDNIVDAARRQGLLDD
ncbi:MAG: response regulator transcription factor [Anaerolineae bacterium]|nr:response regulator transcription factor [Anaerolineae bacterium]